jgi:hypothetical protein
LTVLSDAARHIENKVLQAEVLNITEAVKVKKRKSCLMLAENPGNKQRLPPETIIS